MPSRGINILRKITKAVAFFLLFIGLISITLSITKLISWKLKKDNYTEKPVYNMGSFLIYHENGKVNYIDNIVDVLGQKKKVSLPIGSLVNVYIDNSNLNRCVYLDMNNSFDSFVMNPVSDIEIIYVFFASFLGFIFATALKEEYVFIMSKSLRRFALVIAFLGIVLLITEGVLLLKGVGDVKNIIGGIIIAFVGLHFTVIDDVGKNEEE